MPPTQAPGAAIRFFCPLSYTDEPLAAARYLGGLLGTGLGVRALPLFGATMSQWGAWAKYARAFHGPLGDRYVNVVCAPPGLRMGRPITAASVAPPARLAGGTAVAAADRDEIVYEPKTALAGLWTRSSAVAGNVAITIPPDRGELADAERAALELYDLVVCPTGASARRMLECGVVATEIDPSDVTELRKMMETLLDRR